MYVRLTPEAAAWSYDGSTVSPVSPPPGVQAAGIWVACRYVGSASNAPAGSPPAHVGDVTAASAGADGRRGGLATGDTVRRLLVG